MVVALAVGPRHALATRTRLALPQAGLRAGHGFHRAQRQPVRQERQRAAALQALDVLEEQRMAAVVAAKSLQGRTTRLLCTSFTPLVLRAMYSACAFSAFDFAKPDKATVPFRVSTL